MSLHPPLPAFPPVPTIPMSASSERCLVDALLECRKMLPCQPAQVHVTVGYAMIWLHLAMERHLDPRKVIPASSKGHRALLPAFLGRAAAIGLHDRVALGALVPRIASRAADLWLMAKKSQGDVLSPLPYPPTNQVPAEPARRAQ